jgi:hypothetical protein
MEAISGQPWASEFIANRTEGKVVEGGITNDKGTILQALEQQLEHPIQEAAKS